MNRRRTRPNRANNGGHRAIDISQRHKHAGPHRHSPNHSSARCNSSYPPEMKKHGRRPSQNIGKRVHVNTLSLGERALGFVDGQRSYRSAPRIITRLDLQVSQTPSHSVHPPQHTLFPHDFLKLFVRALSGHRNIPAPHLDHLPLPYLYLSPILTSISV